MKHQTKQKAPAAAQPKARKAPTPTGVVHATIAKFIHDEARRYAVYPHKFNPELFDLELVWLSAKTARRFREVERALQLNPGDVLGALIGVGEKWWTVENMEADEDISLVDWVSFEFELENEKATARKLYPLCAQWLREDATGPAVETVSVQMPRERVLALRTQAAAKNTTLEAEIALLAEQFGEDQ
jgi:hypothetical protein